MRCKHKDEGIKKLFILVVAILLGSVSLTAKAADVLEQGIYEVEVELGGGSGRAYVESPMQIKVENTMMATVVMSSPYFEYIKVNGTQYNKNNEEGNAVFEIPIESQVEELEFSALTVAMSEPHEIDYRLQINWNTLKSMEQSNMVSMGKMLGGSIVAIVVIAIVILFSKRRKRKIHNFLFLFLFTLLISGCGKQEESAQVPSIKSIKDEWNYTQREALDSKGTITLENSMELQYADNFKVDYYSEGYKLVSICDGSSFLVVPEGKEVISDLDEDIQVLEQPLDHIYLAATSAMCQFKALERLNAIHLVGTKESSWYDPVIQQEMKKGNIVYAGKYNEPDYEMMLASKCRLAIESTMIFHSPEVKEKLREIGINVLLDWSSYETHPLGRTEWLKLYAALFNQEELAEELFQEQVDYLEQTIQDTNSGKTVAFFYISSSGYIVARKSGDYLTKMIELAGGNYIFKKLGDDETATSTITMEMEEFYATAKEADYIIYNGTVDGGIETVTELLSKNKLLQDFKAVKEGNVWCTNQNFYQDTTQFGRMIAELHQILTTENLVDMDFIYHVQ